MAYNDEDDRVGLRGYVQFKKHTHTHTYIHTNTIREDGLGLTSSNSIKGVAYIGCHALVLGRVIAAFTRGNLPSLLERLPEKPMAPALLEEFKTVVTKVKKKAK